MINGLYLEPYQNVSKDDVLNYHANGEASFPIRFCPMCGRDLREDE